MKKVLILMAVLAIIAVAIPAIAMPTSIDPTYSYWKYQWFTGFDGYNEGVLANPNTVNVNNSPVTGFDSTGQDGWLSPKFTSTATLGSLNASGNIVDTLNAGYTGPQALSARHAYRAGPGGNASLGYANTRNMRTLNSWGGAYNGTTRLGGNYQEGFVEYWIYDPRGSGTAGESDVRGWVASPIFDPTSNLTSSSYTWGATLGDSRLDGKTHWVFAMGGSFLAAKGNGGTLAGGAGGGLVFTAVAGQERARTIGWHQVQLYWNYTTTTARLEMYVDDMYTPCVVADMTSVNSRWANYKGGVSSLFIGNTQGVTTKAGLIDEVSFYGRIDPNNPYGGVPEPSGLMALGAGAMGLLGLIRRRR